MLTLGRLNDQISVFLVSARGVGNLGISINIQQ